MEDVSHERELREQWQDAHEKVHESDHESLAIARSEINRRLDEMNQLRSQIDQERGRYVQRDYFDKEHTDLRNGLDTRLKLLETTKSNLEGRLWMMGAAVSGVVVIVNFVMYYLMHK